MQNRTGFEKSFDFVTNRETLNQALRFGVVGVANTIIGLGSIYGLMAWVGLNPFLSNIVGYGIALANSYFLNKIWTFKDRRRDKGRIGRFLMVFGLSYGLQMLFLWLLILPMQVDPYIAQLIAMFAYTGINFLGNKLFTFKTGSQSPSRGSQ